MAVLVALAMPVLVGTMGLAAEASYWYVHQRGMQNAADAAAIAAATERHRLVCGRGPGGSRGILSEWLGHHHGHGG